MKQIRVLIIEDDPEYTWMISLLLQESHRANFEIHQAALLSQAFQILSQNPVDIILLDLTLPDGKGIGTFRELYTHTAQIPIVIMTAMDDRDLALQAVHEGAQDFLVKGRTDVEQLILSMLFAIERQESIEALRRISLFDELTGLLNRRGFLTLAKQQIKIARRAQRHLMLFFLDLDGLKTINDQFGHPEGDQALRQVADILRQTFRSSDIIARLGGDEFTVLAIDAPEQGAKRILTRLSEQIDGCNSSDKPYTLSISVGLARFDPQKTTGDINQMLDEADQALYAEKRRKRAARE